MFQESGLSGTGWSDYQAALAHTYRTDQIHGPHREFFTAVFQAYARGRINGGAGKELAFPFVYLTGNARGRKSARLIGLPVLTITIIKIIQIL
jgi:hypothetical protein